MASAMQIAFISFVSSMVLQTMGDRDGSQRCTDRDGHCANSDSADVLLTRSIKMQSGSRVVSEKTCPDLSEVVWTVGDENTFLYRHTAPTMSQTGCAGDVTGPVKKAALPEHLRDALERFGIPDNTFVTVPYTIEDNTITVYHGANLPIAKGTIVDTSGSYTIEWEHGATWSGTGSNSLLAVSAKACQNLNGVAWTVDEGSTSFLYRHSAPTMSQSGCGGTVAGPVKKAALPENLRLLLEGFGIPDNTVVSVPFTINDNKITVFHDETTIATGTIDHSSGSYTINWDHGATWSGTV